MDPLLELVHGEESEKASNLNRLKDTDANIANLRREFIGKPQVCYSLASHIVHLRRDVANVEHHIEFDYLLKEYTDTIIEHMDIRWLLSICDTLVDIGDTHTRAVAMNIVQCVNDTNIHLTIIANVENGNLDPSKLTRERKMRTWGGMITADIPTGDMIYNQMCRLNSVISQHELLNKIWCKIRATGREEGNVVMNHLCAYSTIPHQKEYFHENHK